MVQKTGSAVEKGATSELSKVLPDTTLRRDGFKSLAQADLGRTANGRTATDERVKQLPLGSNSNRRRGCSNDLIQLMKVLWKTIKVTVRCESNKLSACCCHSHAGRTLANDVSLS